MPSDAGIKLATCRSLSFGKRKTLKSDLLLWELEQVTAKHHWHLLLSGAIVSTVTVCNCAWVGNYRAGLHSQIQSSEGSCLPGRLFDSTGPTSLLKLEQSIALKSALTRCKCLHNHNILWAYDALWASFNILILSREAKEVKTDVVKLLYYKAIEYHVCRRCSVAPIIYL